MHRILLALAAALALSACAVGRTPINLATADGAQRYTGERTHRGGDAFALTASSGAACEGDLYPTTDNRTGNPASFGGVSCDDGRVGMLLFDGAPSATGGPISGVIDQRAVKGGWGSSAGGAV